MRMVKFTLNDWLDWPDSKFLDKLLGDNMDKYLCDDQWCKDQNIAVVVAIIDMSFDFCITAPYEWVEDRCPEILKSNLIDKEDAKRNRHGTPYHNEVGTWFYNDNGWNWKRKKWDKYPYLEHITKWCSNDGTGTKVQLPEEWYK